MGWWRRGLALAALAPLLGVACGGKTDLFLPGGGGSGNPDGGDGSVSCGNGIAERGESCDGADLAGESCERLGFEGGRLRCSADCNFDTSRCQGSGTCGNGIADPGEECDGADLGGASCDSLGFEGGQLRCNPDCGFDTRSCGGAGGCPEGDLGSNLGSPVLVATTQPSTDDFEATCGGFDVADSDFFWTAPADGCFRFDTNGSQMDTVLMLQDSCRGPELACDDDGGNDVFSRIDREFIAGESVLVSVESFFDGEVGEYTLNINPCEGPGFETQCANGLDDDEDGFVDCDDSDCANSPACGADCPAIDLGPSVGTFESNTTGRPSSFTPSCAPGSSPDTSLLWTAPVAGCFNFDTNGSDFDTVLSLQLSCTGPEIACDDDGGEPPASQLNRNFAEGEQVLVVVDGFGDASSGRFALNIRPCDGMGVETQCFNGLDDDRDGQTDCDDPDCLPFCPPRIETDCGNFVDDDFDMLIDCEDPDCFRSPLCSMRTETNCTNGADDDGDGLIDCQDPDCNGHPACDMTCDSEFLGSALGQSVVRGNTRGGPRQFTAGCAGGAGSPDNAFRWVAPFSGCFVFDTNGSSYDTALTLQGSCLGPELSCDDDGGQGTNSLIRESIAGGQEILVVVDGFDFGSSGPYVLNINPCFTEVDCQNNVDDDGDGLIDCQDDDCTGDPGCAVSCPDGNLGSSLGVGVARGNTSGADNDFGATCAGGASSPDESFLWVAPFGGCFVFDTNGSDFDTALTLQTTCNGPQIACDDDGGVSTQSLLRRTLGPGEPVIVVVDGFGQFSSGNYILSIRPCGMGPDAGPPPPVP